MNANVKQFRVALAQALANGVTQADVLTALHHESTAPNAEAVIALARSSRIAGHDTEIDAEPLISRGEGGTWVSAWVWVSDDEFLREESAL